MVDVSLIGIAKLAAEIGINLNPKPGNKNSSNNLATFIKNNEINKRDQDISEEFNKKKERLKKSQETLDEAVNSIKGLINAYTIRDNPNYYRLLNNIKKRRKLKRKKN